LKIAILTQYYPPEIGAPQNRLSNLAGHLVSSGHSVTVLTAMPNYPLGRIYDGYGGIFSHELRDGVSVLRTFIYATRKSDVLRRVLNYFSFVISSAIIGTAKLGKQDFLMLESPPLFLGLSALLLARVTGARLIVNVSDLWPDSVARVGIIKRNSVVYKMCLSLEAMLYRNAWLVTGQTKGIVASIRTRFPESDVYHLPNGVDLGRFDGIPSASAREELGGREGFVVVYAGLHGLAQALSQVLEAAAILQAEGKRARFYFIGDGPEKQALGEQARNLELRHVFFTPSIPNAEIPPVLASADAVLVPLRKGFDDAVPSKLYEAMASGTAILATSEGEAAELLQSARAGLVVPPENPEALAAAIRQLMEDPELRRRLASNARQLVADEYDRQKIAHRFESTLLGAATTNRRSRAFDSPVTPV
jgi:glycosyltransferase involved in cell wall biosynthesis